MKLRNLIALCLALLLLTACGQPAGPQRFDTTFLDLFDTVTTVVGYADSAESFRETTGQFHDRLERYHRLFDIYNDYPGLVNLKTVNDRAGQEPVTVDRELLDFLRFCREMEQSTGGMVNVAMGSVLSLWHEARTIGLDDPENAALPDADALREAAGHTSMEDVILDEETCTVRFADSALKLDVGAIAKGYAVQRACEELPTGFLVSVGGNVCATGPKADGTFWSVGLQDPDGEGNLRVVTMDVGSVVTSGDYQRFYTVDGVRYHHIIDPGTRMPGDKWRAVSVVCADSAVADALSTALFLLDREAGQHLLDRFGAEALWVDGAGTVTCSPGFSSYLKD